MINRPRGIRGSSGNPTNRDSTGTACRLFYTVDTARIHLLPSVTALTNARRMRYVPREIGGRCREWDLRSSDGSSLTFQHPSTGKSNSHGSFEQRAPATAVAALPRSMSRDRTCSARKIRNGIVLRPSNESRDS